MSSKKLQYVIDNNIIHGLYNHTGSNIILKYYGLKDYEAFFSLLLGKATTPGKFITPKLPFLIEHQINLARNPWTLTMHIAMR